MELIELIPSINWPEVLAGALLPGLAQLVVIAVRFYKIRRSSLQRRMLGDFILYRYSPMQQHTVRHDKIRIHTSILGRVLFEYIQKEEDPDNLEGYVVFGDGGNIYLQGRGTGHNESGYFIFRHAIDVNFRSIFGIFCAIDLDYKPVAMHCVLSRRQLDDNDVRVMLNSYFIMRAKSRPSTDAPISTQNSH